MISCEIYIKVDDEFKRIDLFKDEKISITSSIQNVNDLSKIFTDYSQSFTIPASSANNMIFNYWNENGVNEGFDQRIRYDAFIEINTIPFRTGKIQIEKANEKNNRIESYSITFYGATKQIKDLFKEDKLSILDYSDLNHTYSATEVKNRITTGVDDVFYPLIGNKHKYEYLTGGANDITVGGDVAHSINYVDLFPAIPVSVIFDKIQAYYGLTFTGIFFDTSYWIDLFLYCKNIEVQKVWTAPVRLDFTNIVAGYSYPSNISSPMPITNVDLTNNTITFKTQTLLNYNIWNNNATVVIAPTDPTIQYRVITKRIDGSVVTINDNLYGSQAINVYNSINIIQETVYFEVESELPITYSYSIIFTMDYISNTVYGGDSYNVIGTTQSTVQNMNINTNIPDIKIVDFFNGIMKMFNLTINPTGENTFEILPLDFFYAYGNDFDINSYVINDSVDIERTKLFKKLNFSYEKSENVLNNYFRNTFNRGYDYGDLIFDDALSNDSTNYEIKVPFEDVMWERSTTGNFQTASLIDKDLKPYKPKVMLMYKNDIQNLSTPIQYYDGASFEDLGKYVRFSNELEINGQIASLNWGEEQSSWNLSALANYSLYENWYRTYIAQLYDIRARIVKLKAILPQTILSDIKLNDRIIYKDKRYVINQFTTDLTSGEVDFELLTDFRDLETAFTPKTVFKINNQEQDVELIILKLDYDSFDVIFKRGDYLDNTTDINLTLTVPVNLSGDIVYNQVEITYYKGTETTTKYITIIQDA